MQVGLSMNSTFPGVDGPSGARAMIDRARAARDADLDSLSLGDHHARPSNYFQGVPMMGRLLAEWNPSRPAGCLFLLPIWNPLLVAENIGTLACLIDAPFIVQTGIGGGGQQFAAMGSDLRRRGRDLDESIRMIKALLAGETVASERFGLSQAIVNPRPPQAVDWWIGAGGGKPIERAAREGDAWYGAPGITPETAPALLDQYRAACANHGRTPRPLIRKDVLVLRDGERAARVGGSLVESGYRGMERRAVVYGTVEQVAEELAVFEDLGFEQVVARCMADDQADAVETIELLGEVRRLLA